MRHVLLGLGIAVMLSGCGDPLRDVARLGDVSVADGGAMIAQSPADIRNKQDGLFANLLNRQLDDPTNAAVNAALADVDGTVSRAAVSQDKPAAAAPTPERRGWAGLFRRSPNRNAPRNGPDASDVIAGAVLPFGQIARVCGLPPSQLGSQIDAASGYRIYDTIPGSNAPRPFYISGFGDDCVRTFTGAVVISGDAETHEFVRYRPSNARMAYTSTDNAYEALKASVCRVGSGQPCGNRLAKMEENTRFITVYNMFGGTYSSVPTQWAQILLHNGEVVSMSIKGSG